MKRSNENMYVFGNVFAKKKKILKKLNSLICNFKENASTKRRERGYK